MRSEHPLRWPDDSEDAGLRLPAAPEEVCGLEAIDEVGGDEAADGVSGVGVRAQGLERGVRRGSPGAVAVEIAMVLELKSSRCAVPRSSQRSCLPSGLGLPLGASTLAAWERASPSRCSRGGDDLHAVLRALSCVVGVIGVALRETGPNRIPSSPDAKAADDEGLPGFVGVEDARALAGRRPSMERSLDQFTHVLVGSTGVRRSAILVAENDEAMFRGGTGARPHLTAGAPNKPWHGRSFSRGATSAKSSLAAACVA